MFLITPAATPEASLRGGDRARVRLAVRGAVQGVGFRPFVFRLAAEHRLAGWVANSAQGVFVEVEGPRGEVQGFCARVGRESPPRSSIQSLEAVHLDPVGYTRFEIRPSEAGGAKTALVMPDIAVCADCLREVLDAGNRRFGYPFANCTNCGPRFSIIEALPYDRPNTSMKGFAMCPRCQAEYEDPADRRFHAQPTACAVCGPRVELWDAGGRALSTEGTAIRDAAKALVEGAIVAVKGLGGFHLLVAARDARAVERLRARKHREEKPFALMFPSLPSIRAECEVSGLEERLLGAPEAPIVLLRRRRDLAGRSGVAAEVAPGNPYLGVILPYTPLHHLLLREAGLVVVATSGNRSEEPICIDERDALDRLGGIADQFLVHNRPIVRHVDDSVVRVVLGREQVLRRARGYAPLPVTAPWPLPPTLAVGAHLKNTVALAVGRQVFLSQHIGDLGTALARAAFEQVAADLPRLYATRPELVAADAHPDYASTHYAGQLRARVVCVQHHYAHVLACMGENHLGAPALGVAWDGTGLGDDGTVWGGEFLLITEPSFQRVGHLRTFRLPGGDQAAEQPRRAALGVLHELFGEETFAMSHLLPLQAFSAGELTALRQMLLQGVNSPVTSSAGRLFDAVASLTGMRQQVRFEGQAAIDLEFAMEPEDLDATYPFALLDRAAASPERSEPRVAEAGRSAPPAGGPQDGTLVLDWGPIIRAILTDLRLGVPVWRISARFHNALAEAIVAVARRVGEQRVVLSGGCFQNKHLLEYAVHRLRAAGFTAYWHQRVPPNDGGIALGQALGAARAVAATSPDPCA